VTTAHFQPVGPLRGTLALPGDKSISHRALLLAALADGESRVTGLSRGDDVLRTATAVATMGAVIDGDRIAGGRLQPPADVVDCGNSGTGIRLLAGWCAPRPWTTVLTGDDSVRRRPMGRVIEPLAAMGARIGSEDGRAPLTVEGGPLRGVDQTLSVASAQVKSAVLFAGLSADGRTVVREPAPTRAHTEEMMAAAGVDITSAGGVVRLMPSPVQPFNLSVPADPSQAAFWAVAATLVEGSELRLPGVYVGPARAGFLDVLRRMGADIEIEPGPPGAADLVVRHAELGATLVTLAEVPGLVDEIPVLAVAAAAAVGTTRFEGVGELRVKESDRIETMADGLRRIGVEVATGPDWMEVTGGAIQGGAVVSHGDHRVAMSLAVAGLVARGPVDVEGWEAVATSYPGFQEDLRQCVS
jgi:3-phosphoshikimate 1-carboxyvinyltransferase